MGLGNAFEGAYSTLPTVTGSSPGESEPPNMQEAVSMMITLTVSLKLGQTDAVRSGCQAGAENNVGKPFCAHFMTSLFYDS